MRKSTKPKRGWLTQVDMAASCDMSTVGFQRWGVDPVDKTGRYTYYRVADVLANRLENLETQLQKRAPADMIQAEREAKLKLTEAQVEGQELKNAQLRKELAPIDIIEWTLGKVGGQISAILDALPLQLKKRNPKLTASNIETIRREIVKAQNIAALITVDYDEYQRNED